MTEQDCWYHRSGVTASFAMLPDVILAEKDRIRGSIIAQAINQGCLKASNEFIRLRVLR